jgi:hypothetical protein
MVGKKVNKIPHRIKIQKNMRAFMGTELNTRNDKDIVGQIMGLDHSLDLVMISNSNPGPKVFCTGKKGGYTDCSVRMVRMDMHIHRDIALFPDFVEERGSIVYFFHTRADHTKPGGVDIL